MFRKSSYSTTFYSAFKQLNIRSDVTVANDTYCYKATNKYVEKVAVFY
jgi:hypothetical protein